MSSYAKAQDILSRAQAKLRLSEALSAKGLFIAPSGERTDYCRDLESEAFKLFEEAMQAFKAADREAV